MVIFEVHDKNALKLTFYFLIIKLNIFFFHYVVNTLRLKLAKHFKRVSLKFLNSIQCATFASYLVEGTLRV